MKISTIVDKIRLEKKEFVTSDELEKYCKAFKIDHRAAIHYLTKMRYLVRIFRGIFYVRTLKEFKLGMTTRYNHLTSCHGTRGEGSNELVLWPAYCVEVEQYDARALCHRRGDQ